MSWVCLRCDWAGEGAGGACPNCGAPLYRTEPAPKQAQPERRSPARVPEEEEVAVRRPLRQGRPALALLLAFVIVAGAAGWFFHTFTRSLPSAGAGGGRLRGRLVYVAEDGAGARRLYTLDLTTGVAAEGPLVGDVLELEGGTSAPSPGIGATIAEPSGTLRADIYRSFGPDDQPVTIGRGNLVAWGPQAETIATVRRGPGRCGVISVTSINVSSVSERIYHRASFCEKVLAVGRDAQTVYLLERREHSTGSPSGSTGIVWVGYERLHPLLERFSFLSISPTADMIVVAEPGAGWLPGAALFWRGNSRTPPVAYADGGVPLIADRVLAWAGDDDQALVLGSVGRRRGLYLLDAGVGQGPRAPEFVGDAQGPVWATFSDDGHWYVEEGGAFSVVTNGIRAPLEHLARSAPPPDGPIAWLP